MFKSRLFAALTMLWLILSLTAQNFSSDFYYHIKNAEGKVVGNGDSSTAGAFVYMETLNTSSKGQYWAIENVGGGFVIIKNTTYGQNLDNNNSGTRQVLQWTNSPANQNQHWKLTEVAGKEGWYTLSARSNPSQNIAYNANNSLTAVAANSSASNQQFQLVITDIEVTYPKQAYWEDEAVFEENKEKANATYTPYPNKAALLADNAHFAHPWLNPNTTRIQSLNGTWKFNWVKQPSDSIEGFYSKSFDDSSWSNIRVPSNWEMEGFGHPFYMNEEMPFENQPPYIKVRGNVSGYDNNSIGSYRRNFTIPSDWNNKTVFINFEGIYSAAYVYVNGEYVGYTEAANTDHKFDITDYIQTGENLLAVKVHRWSDGSYLENQDMFRMSGIYRDVNLIAVPKTYVRDHQINSIMASPTANNGNLSVDLRVSNSSGSSSSGKVEVEFLDASGNFIDRIGSETNFSLNAGEEKKITLSSAVSNVKLWSAEHPNLYTVIVKLKDSNGNETEAFATKYGFRTIEIKNNLVYINGERILFKGANRHDSDPELGRAVTTDLMLKDVLLFKQYNLNTIRTSHYPNPAKMYAMFDYYGLYVMDEADLECHGAQQLSGMASWIPAFINRVERMVYRDRNHPSVVFWSLGNESGGGSNFNAVYDYVKAFDTTRPVHYEGGDSKHSYYSDLQSKMYPPVDWIVGENNSNANKPLFICEFAHAMGNALGNFQEYMDVMEDSKRTIGGCVWDWVDQAIYHPQKLKLGIKEAYSTGYDFGGPHQGNFCSNGILSPSREVSPKLVEVKRVYQYVRFEEFDSSTKSFKLTNRYAFANLDNMKIKWTVLENGETFETGLINSISAEPGESIVVEVPYSIANFNANNEYLLTVELVLDSTHSWNTWAEEEHSVASNQFAISSQLSLSKMTTQGIEGVLTVKDEGARLEIEGDNFSMLFNKTNGKLANLTMDGVPVIQSNNGFEFDFFRFVENDVSIPGEKTSSFENTPLSYEISEDGKAISITTTRRSVGQADYDMDYTIYANGVIDIETRFRPLKNDLPRLGLSFKMNKNLSNVDYYAHGPYENYNDRKSGSFLGRYMTTVDEMLQDYVRPQSNGNREGLRFVSFTDGEGKGIKIETEGQVSFSSIRYSDQEIVGKMHYYDLLNANPSTITVHLDYMQRGVGNGSCCGGSTTTLSKYRVGTDLGQYKIRITPASGVVMPDYCEPSGTTKDEGFVQTITSTNTKNNFQYSADTPLAQTYNHLIERIEAEPGATIQLNLLSNVAEGMSKDDFRQNYAVLFLDKNHDLQFTEDEIVKVVGERGNDLPSSGNMDVLNFTAAIALPNEADGTSYRLRILFDDAKYTGSLVDKACGVINGGAVYDIDIVLKETSYCTPNGSFHAEEKAYLKEINTTGAEKDINYSSESFPGSVYVKTDDVIHVKPGSSFGLNLIANVAGPKNAVHQDLRYNTATVFADWNLDGDLTEIARFGKISSEGLNGISANYDEVLDIDLSVDVPASAAFGEGVIRVIYQNAWKGWSATPCMQDIFEGMAYDISVKIIDENTSTPSLNSANTAFRIYPTAVKNQLTIENTQSNEGVITILDLNGKSIMQDKISKANTELQLNLQPIASGIYFIRIDSKDNAPYVAKFLKQ